MICEVDEKQKSIGSVLTVCIIKTSASGCCRRRRRRRRLIRCRRQPTFPPTSRRRWTRSRRRKRVVGVGLLLETAVDAKAALLGLHCGRRRLLAPVQVTRKVRNPKLGKFFWDPKKCFCFVSENFSTSLDSLFFIPANDHDHVLCRTFPVRKLRTECRSRTRDGAIYFFLFCLSNAWSHSPTLTPLSLALSQLIQR